MNTGLDINSASHCAIPSTSVYLPTSFTTDFSGMEEMMIDRFMQYLVHVPNRRVEIKILSAIQFTADMLDCSDAHVSKTLVDHGLRAARMAFPMEFLTYVDQALTRSEWEVGGPNRALLELKAYWDKSGESRLTSPSKTGRAFAVQRMHS